MTRRDFFEAGHPITIFVNVVEAFVVSVEHDGNDGGGGDGGGGGSSSDGGSGCSWRL